MASTTPDEIRTSLDLDNFSEYYYLSFIPRFIKHINPIGGSDPNKTDDSPTEEENPLQDLNRDILSKLNAPQAQELADRFIGSDEIKMPIPKELVDNISLEYESTENIISSVMQGMAGKGGSNLNVGSIMRHLGFNMIPQTFKSYKGIGDSEFNFSWDFFWKSEAGARMFLMIVAFFKEVSLAHSYKPMFGFSQTTGLVVNAIPIVWEVRLNFPKLYGIIVYPKNLILRSVATDFSSNAMNIVGSGDNVMPAGATLNLSFIPGKTLDNDDIMGHDPEHPPQLPPNIQQTIRGQQTQAPSQRPSGLAKGIILDIDNYREDLYLRFHCVDAQITHFPGFNGILNLDPQQQQQSPQTILESDAITIYAYTYLAQNDTGVFAPLDWLSSVINMPLSQEFADNLSLEFDSTDAIGTGVANKIEGAGKGAFNVGNVMRSFGWTNIPQSYKVYNGISESEYTFTWNFFWKSETQANKVLEIIKAFRFLSIFHTTVRLLDNTKINTAGVVTRAIPLLWKVHLMSTNKMLQRCVVFPKYMVLNRITTSLGLNGMNIVHYSKNNKDDSAIFASASLSLTFSPAKTPNYEDVIGD